ncbi:unnamed protein product, partial [Prorocentrum cordatum]
MRVGLAPEHRRASAVPALAGQARGLDDTAVARRAGLPGFCSQRKVGHHVGVPPMLLASPSSLAHARLEGRRSPSSAAVGPLRRARRLRAALFRRARRAASVLQPGPHRKKGRAVRAPWPCEGRFGGAASEARPTEAVQEGPRRQGCQGTLGGGGGAPQPRRAAAHSQDASANRKLASSTSTPSTLPPGSPPSSLGHLHILPPRTS